MEIFWALFMLAYLGSHLPTWMTQRALREYQAGRPARAVVWAKRTLAWGRWMQPSVRASAHQIAGLGYSEQGHLEEAQAEYQQAYQIAHAAGKPDQAARSLTLLSGLQLKRGFVAEALATARQAAGRDALSAEADCLRTLGRWADALDAYRRAQQAPPLAGAAHERRSQAALRLGLAWTHAEAAQATGDRDAAEQAWAALEEAATVFEDDRKLHLWCEATAPWVEAMRGNEAEARRVLPIVQAQLADFARSRATLLNACSLLGRAALLLGDFPLGAHFWEQFFAQAPHLPDQARGRYFWGECLSRMGGADAARDQWRQAVALNVDTYYARCARHRLAEAEGTVPAEPDFARGPKSDTWPPPPSRSFPV